MIPAKLFLIVSAFVLIPIGIIYGSVPERSMFYVFGLLVDRPDASLIHMLRALAGLYCTMGLFWLIGAFHASIRVPALWSVLVLMTGVATGRLFGFLFDGIPDFWGFSFFFFSEVGLLIATVILIRSESKSSANN